MNRYKLCCKVIIEKICLSSWKTLQVNHLVVTHKIMILKLFLKNPNKHVWPYDNTSTAITQVCCLALIVPVTRSFLMAVKSEHCDQSILALL